MYLCVKVIVRKNIQLSEGVFLNSASNVLNIVFTTCYCRVYSKIMSLYEARRHLLLFAIENISLLVYLLAYYFIDVCNVFASCIV